MINRVDLIGPDGSDAKYSTRTLQENEAYAKLINWRDLYVVETVNNDVLGKR